MPTIQEQKVLFHILTNDLGEGATPPHHLKPLSTMATFHKVVTRITDRKNTITYAGTIDAEKRPENTFEETFKVDIYNDYFDTEKAAFLFIRTQSQYI